MSLGRHSRDMPWCYAMPCRNTSDNTVMYSRTFVTHIRPLEAVLNRLRDAGITLNITLNHKKA